jgi:hypothetical protein
MVDFLSRNKKYKVTNSKGHDRLFVADSVVIKEGMILFYGAMPKHDMVAAVAIEPGLVVVLESET